MSTAALVIAVVSLVISVASLTWQAASFILSGARVKVALKHGAIGRGIAITGQPGRFDLRSAAEEGYTQEVLAVEAINVGRMAVSISRVAARFSNGMTVVEPVSSIPPSLPYRLEPQEKQTFYFPMLEVHKAAYAVWKALGENAQRVWLIVELGNGETVRTRESLEVPGA